LFTDSLYTFYHNSYTNTYKLYAVAEGIQAELIRLHREGNEEICKGTEVQMRRNVW